MFIPWLFLILPEGLSRMKGCAVQIDAAATVCLVPKVIKLCQSKCILAAWRAGGEGGIATSQRAEGGEEPIMHSPHSTFHLLGSCIKELNFNKWQESYLDKKSSVHANARKQQLPFIPICSILYEGRIPGCSSTLSPETGRVQTHSL